ncbi:MAG TPA: LPS-assembly protein LptD [Anaeromyxobacter sp.]
MTPLAALAAAGLVAPLVAAAAPPAPSPDVKIEGDVTYQPGTGRLLVENGAVLRRGAVTIRSRSATYDPETGEVRASGGVLLTDPTRAIRADGIRAVLGGEWEAEGVVAFVKDVPVDLGSVDTIEAARGRGRNRLSFSGSHLRGDATGRLFLDGARLTLCDCQGGAPSWEVTSRKADVVPGKRAILSWPVLRITPRFLFVNRPVPVLVLPWLYLPLGDRQSGLLLPEIRKTGATGTVLAQPLFLTLGRSADATLTAEYDFGPSRLDPRAGAVRGPGARLELRWAPAQRSEGRVEVAWVHDLYREPPDPAGRLGESGDRFAISGYHAQRIGDGTSLAARLELAGDPVWVRDHTSDFLGRSVPYRRSAVLVSGRGDALAVEGDAGYVQPLRPDGILPGEPYGLFGSTDRVANRWPALAASLLPTGAGPLQLSGRLGAARYAPVSGPYDAAGRAAATRASGQVEAAAPLLVGGAVTVSPYLRGAAAGYSFEASRAALASAWAVAGVSLATEVSRRFGSVQHAIVPRLEWRTGSGVAGDRLPWLAYDAVDRSGAGLLSSGPPGAWQQLRGSLGTRLSRGAVDLVRLEIGQDLDLRRERFAETFASAGATAGAASLDAAARFLAIDGRGDAAGQPPRIPSALLDRFTELRASVSVADRRGDSLHAGFFTIGAGGSGALIAGADPLFDLRAAPIDATAGMGVGARVVLGPAALTYDVGFPGRATFAQACNRVGERRLDAWQATQHAATFVWDSPCRCFRIAATASVDDCARSLGDVNFSASIDLSRLGAGRALQ